MYTSIGQKPFLISFDNQHANTFAKSIQVNGKDGIGISARRKICFGCIISGMPLKQLIPQTIAADETLNLPLI